MIIKSKLCHMQNAINVQTYQRLSGAKPTFFYFITSLSTKFVDFLSYLILHLITSLLPLTRITAVCFVYKCHYFNLNKNYFMERHIKYCAFNFKNAFCDQNLSLYKKILRKLTKLKVWYKSNVKTP